MSGQKLSKSAKNGPIWLVFFKNLIWLSTSSDEKCYNQTFVGDDEIQKQLANNADKK